MLRREAKAHPELLAELEPLLDRLARSETARQLAEARECLRDLEFLTLRLDMDGDGSQSRGTADLERVPKDSKPLLGDIAAQLLVSLELQALGLPPGDGDDQPIPFGLNLGHFKSRRGWCHGCLSERSLRYISPWLRANGVPGGHLASPTGSVTNWSGSSLNVCSNCSTGQPGEMSRRPFTHFARGCTN